GRADGGRPRRAADRAGADGAAVSPERPDDRGDSGRDAPLRQHREDAHAAQLPEAHRLPAPGGGAQGAGGPASLSSSASLSAAAPWSAAAAAVPEGPQRPKREQPDRRGARRRGRASFPIPPGAVPVVRQPQQAPLLGRFGQGAPEPAGTPAPGADPLRQVAPLHRAFLGRPGEVVDLTVEVPLGGRLRPARSAAGPHHSRRVRLRAPRAGTEAPWPLRLPLTAPGPAL